MEVPDTTATTVHGNTQATPRVDVAHVRELLESAARRHRKVSEQVVEFGDDPSATQYPVKDVRKCDYALSHVERHPHTAVSVSVSGEGPLSTSSSVLKAQQQQRRGSSAAAAASASSPALAATAVDTETTSTTSGDNGSQDSVAWRTQLQLHVVHLLQRLRARPEQLRDFLLVHYEDESETSARRWLSVAHTESDESSDGDRDASHASVAEHLACRERVHKKRMGKNYAKLRFVFAQLHRVAVGMGEQLFQQVRAMVRRSVAAGVLSRPANLVRLESIYKLELRRQVTIESLLAAVRTQDAERKRKNRRKKRDEQHVRAQTLRRKTRTPGAASGSDGATQTATTETGETVQQHRSASHLHTHHSLYAPLVETVPTKSAHAFRMHALECVLASERLRDPQSSCVVSSASELPPPRLVSEQTEELIHEKLTALLYSKSRDAFPVWREPPESGFTRDETLRQLKRVVSVLLTTALFAGISVDQLLEFARVTKWRTCARGVRAVERGASMDELVIVMDGRLDPLPPPPPLLAKTESRRELPRTDAADAAPAAALDTDNRTVAISGSEPLSSVPLTRATSLFFGELGLLSKSEVWPVTLFASSVSVKMLVLSRAAFDAVLLKLFGSGGKSRQALVVATQLNRPSSSPAAGARGAVATALSPSRPLTATVAAKERNLAAAKQMHAQYVLQHREASEASEASEQQAEQPLVAGASAASSPETVPMSAKRTPATRFDDSTIQHFPSFATTARADGSSVAHTFRLKWAQPIAFEMASLDASVLSEWAPSLPDSSAMVDFLSSTSLASTCALFEKRNVLLKHHLRSVCFPHQLHSSSALRESPPHGSDPSASLSSTGSTGATLSSPATSVPYSANQNQESGESGSMTFAQFSEARKRANGSRRQLLLSASAQNLLLTPSSPSSLLMASGSATAPKLAHVPFSRSSFVAESSFAVRRRVKLPLAPNAEYDDEDAREDAELSDAEPQHIASQGHHDQQPSDAVAAGGSTTHDASPDAETTRARKMALDSVLVTLGSPRRSQVLDRNTARDLVVAKYLRASQTQDLAGAAAISSRKHTAADSACGSSAGVDSSHVPLPLRVDLQRRMESVLAALEMTPQAKLALVLKYTHAAHYDKFPLAVVLWEQALRYITQRECTLARLWDFELVASDPRRHFRSLSTHRLHEQRQRDALFSELHCASDVCRDALAELERQCGDTVFVASRAYADKMRRDYTELLFDVEQERLRLIYKDAHPAVAAAGGTGASDDKDDADKEEDRQAESEQWTGRRQWPRTPAKSVRKLAALPCTSNNAEDDDDDAVSKSLQLAGAATAPSARHRLANPQESIYVSVAEQQQQQQLQEHEAQQTAQYERDQQRRRVSSHGGASHRITQRVHLERQVELHALTQRLQAERRDSGPCDELRQASRVAPATVATPGRVSTSVPAAPSAEMAATAAKSELELLQRALHRFLHRPQM